MKIKSHILSAVAAVALLVGFGVSGSGCADPDADREVAIAHQAQLTDAANAAEAAAADELQPRRQQLQDQAAKAEAAMQAAEVGSAEWLQAREAARLVSIDLAAVNAAIDAARKAVADARAQAQHIGDLVKKGDEIMAQHGEEAAAGAVGTGIAAFIPWAAPLLPLAGAVGVAWKKARAARVYRGERDQMKGVAESIVRSIDLAKAVIPEFGTAFEKAAPVISAQQGAARVFVDAAQGKV